MKAVVFTLGCKVNDVESGAIITGLEKEGYEVSRELGYADLYIINTCAVTAEAEHKSRQAISKALKFNPNAKVMVCGCASQKNPVSFAEKDKVIAVTGARRKGQILDIVKSNFNENYCGVHIDSSDKKYDELPDPHCLKTRNFVKIQDGCNRFCSYCIIPYLRGRSRSRSMESAAKEILKGEAQETVITGIDISSYCDDDGNDLSDLLLAVKDADTRIRLGSLEESVITEDFLCVAEKVKNFAPQFHLSLQSGSNNVLKSMNRHYTREDYLKKCDLIYKHFPFAAITTDIIVGFPTETEEDFFESLKIIEEAGFSQVHAFPYSPREGTNAYKKYKDLSHEVKKERLNRLIEKASNQKNIYMNKFIGEILHLVPENYINGYMEGYSENYIRLYLPDHNEKKPISVRCKKLFKDGLLVEHL